MPSGWVLVAALAAGLAAWWLVPPPSLPRLRGPASVPSPWVGWVAAARQRLRELLPSRAEAARDAAVRASVPAVCDLLAVCLEAGRPPRVALRVVAGVVDGPVREVLAGVLAAIDLGVDEAAAWDRLGAAPGYREVGRDLARSVRSGLGLAELLRRHALDARSDQASRAVARARAAGVRSVVPLMLCFLPAFFLLGVVPIFGALAARLLP